MSLLRAAGWAGMVLGLACVPAGAQVFEFTGGSSSLLRARGASLRIHGGDFSARIGVGEREQRETPLVGARLDLRFRGLSWEIGDQAATLALPTDVFGGTVSFPSRGVAVTHSAKTGEVRVFGGATSTGFSTPWFQTAEARTPTGLVFIDRQLTPALRAISRNLVCTRRTSIHGLAWSPRPGRKAAVVGGIGSDEPYGAGSLEIVAPRFAVSATYAAMGDAFRRSPTEDVAASESDRENLQLQFTPGGSLRFTVARQHYVARFSGITTRSTVSSATAGATIVGLRLHGSASLSETRTGSSRGYSASAGREVVRGLEVEAAWYGSEGATGRGPRIVVGRVRESLGPQLTLHQSVTIGNGTRVSWGGRLDLGRMLVSLDHQMTFLPFAPPGRSAFQQVEVFQLRMPLPGGLRMNASTQLDPAGRVRYTAYASGYAYGRPIASTRGGTARDAIAPYVVRGVVVDTAGAPIPGAALRIGGQVAFADTRGRVELRVARKRAHPLEILFDEFMFPGAYTVVSAPASVEAAAGNRAREFTVTLRRR